MNKTNLLIRGAQILNPADGGDGRVGDIAVEDGIIRAVGAAPPAFEPHQIIEAGGLVAAPGFVDLAVSLREPGLEYKGTVFSETRAAAAAGVTTLCCTPCTRPAVDSPATVELIEQRAAAAGFCRVLIVGALSRGLAGDELSEMAALQEAGCIALGNDLNPFADLRVLRRAMEYAAGLEMPLFLHACDGALAAGGCAHEGAVATRLGLAGIPASAEIAALGQCLALAAETGARVHFCRLSCARSVELLADARARGLPVSADVAAHQLFLTEDDISDFNSDCRVLPPLRAGEDRAALREGLRSGVIDAVCSDHQPHDINAKLAPFPSSEPGISALETLLPLVLALAEDGFGLSAALALVTSRPGALLPGAAGQLREGAAADLCLFNPAAEWRATPETLHSSGKNTPFLGATLTGRVHRTLYQGRVVHEPE